MKFGVNMMVWTTRVGRAHEALFARIREWGFDGVEPFLSPHIPEDLPRLRAVLDQHGLGRTTCVVLPREANLVSKDAMTRARGVDFLKKCVDRTAELGGRVMCGPLYAALGVMTGLRRTEDEWQWSVEGMQKAAEHARRQNVVLCPEPLNRFETYFLNTLADAARYVRDVGAPNVKIHFDTFHSNIEEPHPVASLRNVIRDVGHVHLSENDRGIPGTGHCDWRGVLEVLKQSGYSGWLTIESFAQPEPDLAAAAAIWRDLAPTGDDLARQGLGFIRNLAHEMGIA
jgi:D-psicose/D-tagatose/L-ribulose 3-epimerase